MKLNNKRRGLWAAAAIQCGLWMAPACLDAQWVLEKATRTWISGQKVELFLPKSAAGQNTYVEAVLFDERAIPFEVVEVKSDREAVRLRVVVPAGIEPGAHEISVQFSETAWVKVPEIVGSTPDQARSRLEELGLELKLPTTLPGVTLPGVTLPGVTLPGVTLPGVTLPGVTLPGVTLPGVGQLIVGQQDPAAGVLVEAGTRIAVEVAIEAPALEGKSIEEAREIILASGLVPRVVVREATGGPYERVLEQRPAAAQLATLGAEVELVMENRPERSWLWVWLLLMAILSVALLERLRKKRQRKKRQASRSKVRIEAHNDLDRLRQTTAPPVWREPEIRLDIRLLGFGDPGRQTLRFADPEIRRP